MKETITEILSDLNISIADMETLKSTIDPKLAIYVSRAVGQLKAARGCLVQAMKEAA